MRKRIGATVAAGLSLALFATACGSDDDSDNGGEGGEGPFTIGVSNAFVGSEYRTQMIAAIEETFGEYEDEGVFDNLVIENADADVNGQIQQIRNLINQDVDAIIVDPNSATALNAVFEEAMAQDILVFAIDQAVDHPDVINVGISQEELGRVSAEWFAENVGEGASIVTVEGAAGNPATDARWAGAEPVFEEAGIEVLAHGDGGWDQTVGQTTATNLIATYPDIDGIWTYDGMAQGVLRAVEAADALDTLTIGGEARVAFMRTWVDLLDSGSDFQSVGVINPPGTGATALHIAARMLQGEELDTSVVTDNNIVLDIAEPVTNDNLEAEWAEVEDEEDNYVLDSILTADEVGQYFGD
jgi:ribose transport system substrate-binding protein